MKPEKGLCKQCNSIRFINNSKEICIDCVYKNNHKGKSKQQVALERRKETQSKKTYKSSTLKRKPLKPYIKKKTGERGLFIEIWQEREHFCENINCRKFLGHEPKAQYFSHRKSKGAYPELRLEKTDIDILCENCHYEWDFGSKSKIKLKN